jgi:hypothetical protein
MTLGQFRLLRLVAAILTSVAITSLAPPANATDEFDMEALAKAIDDWLASPHADHNSRSFTYWNERGSVPENCAACHSEPGFLDYIGADGSEAGVVNHPAAINAVIGCAACHTATAHALDSAELPSGVSVHGLGMNATCTICHSGRASGDAVLDATDGLDEDTVSADLQFINIHYGVAAAVMQGGDGRAGFHYGGKTYAGQFQHVPGADTCIACHDAHTTQVREEGCLSCHRGVQEFRDIRTRHQDFDGDGDNSKGIHAEIIGLQDQLYTAIQSYAVSVSGTPIGYASGRNPYFFIDSDSDGQIDDSEAVRDNRYQSWTPRLLKAAYNYQVVKKDPGGYVHNPAYLLQLLYDSLESLAEQVEVEARSRHRP